MKRNSSRIKDEVIPNYLTEKRNMTNLVIFTAVFAFLFINIFKPFGSDTWVERFFPGNNAAFIYVAVSFIFVIIGISVLALSRLFMYLFVKQQKGLSWIEYAVWIIIEIFIISLIFTICAVFIRDDLHWQLQWDSFERIYKVLKVAILCTSCIVLLPYAVFWLYLSNEDKKQKIKQMEKKTQQTKEENTNDNTQVIPFYDEKGEIRFTVKLEHIVYINSDDNYVFIKYMNNGKLSDFMLRNSLKRLSEQLKDTPIKRCHRSYMVNLNHVVSLRKHSGDMFLEFDVPDVQEIPVSKTFSESTLTEFLNNQNMS